MIQTSSEHRSRSSRSGVFVLDSLRPAGSPRDEVDRVVMAGLAAGNLEALERLYDRYRAMAYGVAIRVTADPSAAEDVVQEAFLCVWRNPGSYTHTRGSVKTWLLAIVRHRALDAIRRRRATVELPAPDDAMPAEFWTVDVWPEVSARIDAGILRTVMEKVSDVQREALELAYFGGLTQSEIAVQTGVPLGTAKSRIRWGLLTLRRLLEQLDPDPSGSIQARG